MILSHCESRRLENAATSYCGVQLLWRDACKRNGIAPKI